MSPDLSKEILNRIQAKSSTAETELFDRYVHRLIELARKRISKKLARRIDPEDIVQSAYRSFFTHAREGKFVLQRAGDLWRLLAAITLHKLHHQVERHTAQRRDINREEHSQNENESIALENILKSSEPTAEEATEIVEQMQNMMERISPLQQRVFQLRLQGHSVDHIAGEVGRSQRTVRRVLEAVRLELEQSLFTVEK